MGKHAFNPVEPMAYFLTWTPYGTWLPGDDRGWNRKGKAEIQPASVLSLEVARSEMKEPESRLALDHRLMVEQTVRDHCCKRNWHLHALNARSNHVHVVVKAAGYKPETVRDQFKAWCTRRLKEAGVARTRFWTEGGSRRWINDEDGLEGAILYVMEAQDRKGIEEA